jgi:hypothetical protein
MGLIASARLRGRRSALPPLRVHHAPQAGVRWWDNDIDVAVDLAVLPGTPTFDIEEHWVDLVLGVRWSAPVNDNWTLNLRGDIGGFGVELDFTSAVSAGFHYKMTDSMDLDLQYKATWVDFETGAPG